MRSITPEVGIPVLPVSRSSWSLELGHRLVKVVRRSHPLAQSLYVPAGPLGYVTQEKYLGGMTPAEIEDALGLPGHELQQGAWLLALTRLPLESECEQRGLAMFPKGEDWKKGQAAFWEARSQRAKAYGPGAPLPQWEVTVPIPLRRVIFLMPGQAY